jgi:hypothetical protein
VPRMIGYPSLMVWWDGGRRGDGSSSPLNWFMVQMPQKRIPRISIAVLAGSILTAAYFLHWWIHR